MIEASYCHYVATTRGSATGSGLAIYSKYPIEEYNFEEWPNWTTSVENFLDSKGVLYANIRKGEEYVHVFNLHTTSTTYETGSQSDREEQFWQTRRMIDYKNINMNELVLVGGDMNTNRYAYENGEENYQTMLQLLGAAGFVTNGNYQYTYDTVMNPLTASTYEEETQQELLDYMLSKVSHHLTKVLVKLSYL
jgi:endonuclease/exonuclease/phosphatase family metal-dependent hydrolase